MLSFVFTFAFITSAESGCHQQQMCCQGRNITCTALDDGTRQVPVFNPHHPQRHRHRDHHRKTKGPSYFTYQTPFYEASGDGYDLVYPNVYEELNQQRIGKIVFPDVIELEGSGAEHIYNKYAHADESFDDERPNKVPKTNRRQKKKTSSTAPKITHLLFGFPQTPAEPTEDILRYTSRPKRLWLRYSVLDRYLPLTVSTAPVSDDYYDEGPQFMYLEAPPMSCYCDESCIALGDCCSDYTFVCPPQECVVSNWGEWEGCVPDDGICGLGVEQRVRHVTQKPARGGTPCPPLKEMRTCFKLCSKRRTLDDLTTVALLLDYRHNETRSKKSRDNIYWDMPSAREKLKQATSYCVKYKIGWVNRNCWHKQIVMRLYRGNTICAECQPEATLHRNNGRCASDLEDGEQGFWKLIGPKSCNGIWTRISRDDNCHCGRDHMDLDPFLLV